MVLETDTVLDKIMRRTAANLIERQKARPLAAVRAAAEAAPAPRDAIAALRVPGRVSLIAECKHASPSAGVIVEPYDPVALAREYEAHGAAAVSVLTDEPFFKGHLEHLAAVCEAISLPVLRKDFILHPYQVYEARAAGADLVLLIVAALENALLADLYSLIKDLKMTALVEVHNEAELSRALTLTPELLGVNNRDLKTFDVDLTTTGRLIAQVPDDVTFVAESGIKTAHDVEKMGRLGAHAVLVGEALVRATTGRATLIQSFSSQAERKPIDPD
jgi:indole-3-glycerol phosphate synthase